MEREVKVYLMDATTSNSMKSSNPYSGIHETDYVKCLDTMCLNPGCNQGGCMVCIGPESNAVVYDGSSVTSPKNWNNPKLGDPCYALHTDNRNYVVIALEGNGARPSHLGKGFSEDNKMYTLNTIEQHSVCYGIDQQGGKSNCGYAENVMPTLCSDSHGTPHAVCYSVDCRNGCLNKELSITLQAKNQGGFSVNCTPPILRIADNESLCD